MLTSSESFAWCSVWPALGIHGTTTQTNKFHFSGASCSNHINSGESYMVIVTVLMAVPAGIPSHPLSNRRSSGRFHYEIGSRQVRVRPIPVGTQFSPCGRSHSRTTIPDSQIEPIVKSFVRNDFRQIWCFSTNSADQRVFKGRFDYLAVVEEFLFSVRPETKEWGISESGRTRRNRWKCQH